MSDATSSLVAALSAGPLSAADLCAALGVSQPTLSRRVAAAGERVFSFGGARRSTYALRRRIGAHGRFSIHRINPAGLAEPVGEFIPVMPDAYVLRTARGAQYQQGLPWWLQDMRPQGFLGRNFVRTHAAALNLPPDIGLWSDDDCLIAMAEYGEDFSGNLIVGDGALSHFLSRPSESALPHAERVTRYPALARDALAGEAAASSAGGEQPKFCTLVEHQDGPHAVLVKFSVPGDNAITARWRSLLIAEHAAHRILNASGLSAAQSELLFFGDQCFLEMRRFDRVGSRGRRGLVSLAALDHAFVGRANAPWPELSAALARARRITSEANAAAQRLYAFGRLIGNSDMHSGNLAFFHDGEMPLTVAPVFDMLPMHWAPRASGALPTEVPVLAPGTPPALAIWREMLPLAMRYWEALREDARLDDSFRRAAVDMGRELERLAARLGA